MMPTYNGCPDGEFWIDSAGFVSFADTDIGDESHESIAYRNMIDFEQVAYEMIDMGYRGEDYNEEEAAEDYFNMQIPIDVMEQVVGVDKLKDINYDVRWAFIIHEDAIRVVGGDFEVKKINNDTITRIKNFLEEEYDGSELNPDCYIEIEEVLPFAPKPGSPHTKRKSVVTTFRILMESIETTKDLLALGEVREL